ncbi:MAG: hypothetical protein JWQ18_585 [Conexibacter sp.]|nr:hypothetical protein [Conexibacter sp.]
MLSDLYVLALARELRDGDRVHAGANQADVALAVHVARRLWAPSLKAVVSASYVLGDPHDLSHLGKRCYDPALVAGRRATFHQADAFDDLGRAPVMFAGGLQVDGRGNANLIGLPRAGGWKLRGPGSAGLATMTAVAPRFFIACPVHDVRSLVETVERVSVLGDPVARQALGLEPDALAAVITPLARFTPSRDGLLLDELAPGVTLEAVRRETGFAVRPADDVRHRQPPTDEEQDVLDELRAVAEGSTR